MQNPEKILENDLFKFSNCPPPPPVPEKLNLSTQNCRCKHTPLKEVKLPKRSPQQDVKAALRHVTYNFFAENPSNLISLYHPISPVIQEGRCCGIVALSMASQLIQEVSVNDILNLAKSMNFTKEGEMFSAFNMSKLAMSLLNCDTIVIDNLDKHKHDLLSHVCDGWPLLIPYDADRNHFPCSNNGMTAHWSVVTGLCFTVPDKSDVNALENIELIQDYPEFNVFVTKDGSYVKKLLNCSENVFLYARQGKSKHLAAWDLNDLLESNKNMYEVTKKYRSDEMILPEGDSLSELRNKAVLLKRKID